MTWEEAFSRTHNLVHLPHNWDSYGAGPIERHTDSHLLMDPSIWGALSIYVPNTKKPNTGLSHSSPPLSERQEGRNEPRYDRRGLC